MTVVQSQVFEDEFPLIRSCAALNEIRVAEEIKDLRIEVQDGGVLHAHRLVLAARIPSLRASLRGEPNEDNSVLKWPTVPLSIANTFINYVYTGQVQMNQINVRGLALLAKNVDIPVLKNWGATFLAKGLTLDTLSTAWDFARSFNSAPLTEVCINLMQKQFQSFVQSDLFVRLPADALLSLLQKDELTVTSEEKVFAAISKWICPCEEVDQQKLELHAPAMLREVRWCQTTPEFRSRIVDNHQLFKTPNQCGMFMLKVEQWMIAAENHKPPCPFNPRTRSHQPLKVLGQTRLSPNPQNTSSQSNIFLFGVDTYPNRLSVYCLDSDLRRAERVADMESRTNTSYAVNGKQSIFVIGGKTPQQSYSTSVEEFIVRKRTWRNRAPLAIGRWYPAVAVVMVRGRKSLVGAFGGYNGASLSSCELYDTSRHSWFKLPDLQEKRSAWPAAISLPGDSRIFVFGGYNGYSNLASVEFCDLGPDWQQRATSASTADFWRAAAPMLTPRSGLAVTHFRGNIIVAGGWVKLSGLNTVELFTPPDANTPLGQWTALPAMQHPRRYFTLVTSANAVFALGNWWDNTIEAFTPPARSADARSDLTSWMWSPRDRIENLRCIWGAVSLRMLPS